jgi:putative transposase
MRTTFTIEEIARLKENPCVFDCTAKSVNYTFEFKKRALELHAQGVFAKEIWKRSGFDVSKWRKDYCKGTLYDWKKIVKKYGVDGLLKNGGVRFDRGSTKTETDIIKNCFLRYCQG